MGQFPQARSWHLRTDQGLIVVLLAMSACREAVVPLPTPTLSEQEQSASSPTSAPLTVTQPTAISSGQVPYAVAWVGDGGPLAVRQPAGITSMAVAALAADQRGLTTTGKTTQMGSSTWVEINLPEGGKGWIREWNLTEDVPSSAFCGDARVADLANQFIIAVKERDGTKLSAIVSPKRGLIIRHDWWNPEVNIGYSSVSGFFLDPTPITWGINRDSELVIDGTIREVILPQLEDVFAIAPELTCNALGAGSTARDATWPSDYSNLNYISFYRAAPDPGSQLNWRTWALGFEYLNGQPYLTLLIQYRGEI